MINWSALFLSLLSGIVLVMLLPIIFHLLIIVFAVTSLAFLVFVLYCMFKDILEKK